MKAAIILSLALVFSAWAIRNGILKAHSGRYEYLPIEMCSLFDTRTGDCWGIKDGRAVRYNLRKGDAEELTDFDK